MRKRNQPVGLSRTGVILTADKVRDAARHLTTEIMSANTFDALKDIAKNLCEQIQGWVDDMNKNHYPRSPRRTAIIKDLIAQNYPYRHLLVHQYRLLQMKEGKGVPNIGLADELEALDHELFKPIYDILANEVQIDANVFDGDKQ